MGTTFICDCIRDVSHHLFAKCSCTVWRFAGIDPTQEWKKGEKRPWNAALKVLVWKIGDSFVKFQNHPNDIYGKLYVQRKAKEIERNEQGLFQTQAEEKLKRFNIGKSTDAYKAYAQGKLPPAHIHARATRWASQRFLSHYQQVIYFLHFGAVAPRPYVFEHLGHVDEIAPPHMDLIPGMTEAWEDRLKNQPRRH